MASLISYYIVLLDYIYYTEGDSVNFYSSSYLCKGESCVEVKSEKEKVRITNKNENHIPIHMNVDINVDDKTDFILIFRPNLRFYKNGKIEDVISNTDNFSMTKNGEKYDPCNPLKTFDLATGSYIHFPYNTSYPSCNGLIKDIPRDNTLPQVVNISEEYKYPDIAINGYNLSMFNMIVIRKKGFSEEFSPLLTIQNMQIVYNEPQNLKSNNPYTVQTINMNAEEKNNTKRLIEETEFNFGLIISLSVSGIILITLTIVMIVKYLKKRKNVDKTDEFI